MPPSSPCSGVGQPSRAEVSLRRSIRGEIEAITPFDDLERAHRDDALAWVDSGAALCRTAKPATPPQHLVAYFAVVDTGHLLLVDHRNAELWLPPGGHVEPGEHSRETVVREAWEELGFAPEHPVEAPVLITCTTTVGATAGHTDVSLWYVLRADRRRPMVFDPAEFHAIRWFPFGEVPLARSDPHIARFLAKLLRPAASTNGTNAPVAG